MNKRIGVFSGTFDPVHEGHVAFVRAAQAIASLDEVIVIVEHSPRHKRPYASFEHRLAMTTRAFDGIQNVTVRLSAVPTTTFDDLRELSSEKIYLLMGSDVIKHMPVWNNLTEWAPRISVMVGLRRADERFKAINSLTLLGITNHHVISSPHRLAASSGARDDPNLLLPSIANYVAEHRLYE